MAFDEALVARIRNALTGSVGVVEKRMFGGIAFLANGNMSCGVHETELIVRLPPEETEAALTEPHVRVFDLTGRPMKGWVLVAPAGVATEDDLRGWIDRGVKFAGSLPGK